MVRNASFASVFAALGLVGLVVACSSSSSSPPDYSGSCDLLAKRCHPIKTPLGVECHELGHDGDNSKCGPRKDECLAECPETARDAGNDGEADAATDDAGDAAADAKGDASSDPCDLYCSCMVTTCKDEPGYPFADEAACKTACAGFTEENRKCYADACEDAKVAADKKHDCEHASGTVACH